MHIHNSNATSKSFRSIFIFLQVVYPTSARLTNAPVPINDLVSKVPIQSHLNKWAFHKWRSIKKQQRTFANSNIFIFISNLNKACF